MLASWKSCWVLPIVALVSTLVVSTAAQQFYSNGRYGKRTEPTSVNSRGGGGVKQLFWSNSRYGRGHTANQNARQEDVQVAPRADRFYMGSRYGKRSELPIVSDTVENNRDETNVVPEDIMSQVFSTPSADLDSKFTCLYTGITNLYRCFDRKDNVSEDATVQNN